MPERKKGNRWKRSIRPETSGKSVLALFKQRHSPDILAGDRLAMSICMRYMYAGNIGLADVLCQRRVGLASTVRRLIYSELFDVGMSDAQIGCLMSRGAASIYQQRVRVEV